MFYNCFSLTSLNLSNFNTSNVTDMEGMFYGCSSLTSLNLSNFNTSKVTNIYNMFDGCSSLEYINLKNFRDIGSLSVTRFFETVPDNVVVCINEINNINNILDELKRKSCYTIDCSSNWKKNQKKIVNKADLCWNNSNNNILYKKR